MAAIDDIWLAALTKDEDDAGSRNRFNLTVNIDGGDVFAHDFMLGWNVQGQAASDSATGTPAWKRRRRLRLSIPTS